MDYFEQILKEIEVSISIETDKMIDASKRLEETTKKLEELKKQKDVVLAMANQVSREY
jgi:hypothetical protein